MKYFRYICFIVSIIVFNTLPTYAKERFSCEYVSKAGDKTPEYRLFFNDNSYVEFCDGTNSKCYNSVNDASNFTGINFDATTCPSTIYFNEDYYPMGKISSSNFDGAKKFVQITQGTESNPGKQEKFRCRVGQYIITYYTDETVSGTNPYYNTVQFHPSFEKSPSQCPTNLYEYIYGNTATLSNSKVSDSYKEVDTVTDWNAAEGDVNANITHIETIPFPGADNCYSLFNNPDTPGTPAYYLVFAFKVVRYVAIILLIALSVVDFVSATASSDQEIITKATKKTIRRFVLCIVIFALPTLLNFGLNFLYDRKMEICGIHQTETSESEGFQGNGGQTDGGGAGRK